MFRKTKNVFEKDNSILEEANRKLVHGNLIAIVLAANIALIVAIKLLDPIMSKPVGIIYMIGVPAVFAILTIFLVSRAQSSERKILYVFAAFAVFRLVAEISWAILENVLRVETSPSIADFFYLTGYVFISIFLFQYLKPVRENASRQVKLIATMVATAHLIPTSLALGMLNPDLDYFQFVIALAYPIGDAVFLWQVTAGLTLLFNKRHNMFLILLMGGIVGFIVSDTGYVFMTETYETGGLVDLGWISGYILFMFSALCYRPLLKNDVPILDKKTKAISLETMIKFVIPLITVTVVFVATAAIVSHYQSDQDDGDEIGVFYSLYVIPLIISIFVVIIFVLNKSLLKFVKMRTIELEKEQNRLQAELDDKVTMLMKSERLSAIGELSARVAHDLRNPLAIIKSGFEIIRLKDPAFTKETQETLVRIDRALARMSHQIDNVLDYVSPKPLFLKSIWLSELVRLSIERVAIPEDVTIITPKNDFEFRCDQFKMEIVLVNLIANAIQAMKNKGNITIHASEGKNEILIQVQDSGPGIPKDIVHKVFDPLFTTRLVGTGLGLPSYKSIIEKHGGSISISTEIGKGTTFLIKIPKII